jgi:ankyrin repeat protein
MGLLPMVRILLTAGAKPDATSLIRDTVQTAFKTATNHGYWEIVEELLKAGVSVNTKWAGVTPIYSAAARGHLALVKLLIAAGADCITPLGKDAGAEQGYTPLFIAALNGHSAVVNVLATAKASGGGGAPHDQPMSSGLHANRTPLQMACERGHKSVVRLLLKLGVDSTGQHFINALAAARHGNFIAIVKALELFQSKVSKPRPNDAKLITAPAYDTLLYEALVEDFLAAVAEDEDPAVDMANEVIANSRKRKAKSKEPYAMERLFGHEDMSELSLKSVKKLHDLLDDVVLNPQSLRLATIIQYIRKPDVFHFLCNWGWSIHARDAAGNTSAILAAAAIHMPQLSLYQPVEDKAHVRVTPEIIRLLLNRGADPNDKNPLPTSMGYNYSHATPLQMTVYGKDKENELTIQTLIDAGADIDRAVHVESDIFPPLYLDGYTALLHAIKIFNVSVARTLIALNANIYKKTGRGVAAWDLCRAYSEDYVSEETRQQLRDCLYDKEIDHWRCIAAVMDPVHARDCVNLMLQAGAYLSTVIVAAPTLQDPARISTAPQTALYWLAVNHPRGLEIFPPAILQKYHSILLYEAARHGNIKLLQFSLSQIALGKASLDTDTRNSMSNAVYCAAKYGHHQAIAMLIDAGAPFNKVTRIRDNDDAEDESAPARTPLCVAAWFGHTRAAETLMRRTKKLSEAVNTLDAPLSLDTHPLALAAAGGHLAVVKLLLTANPKIDARVKANPTALACAVKRAIQYPSVDALTIIKLLLAAGADRNITYSDPKLKRNSGKKVTIVDIPNCYKLISDYELPQPAWSCNGEGVTSFHNEVRTCLRLPVEEQLHKLLGDFLTRDLIIKVLTAKVAFPPGYKLTPPQGNLPGSVEMLAPATILRELLGLVASHHKIATPPLYGKMYYEDLVMLSEAFAEESDSPAVTLSGEELARLEDVIAKLYKMHLQLLAPEAARFQARGAKSDDKLKPRENKSTTSGVRGVNWFQPAGLPAAPSSQRDRSASSSVSTRTPKKGS